MRRHGAGLRKIAGLATLAIVVTYILLLLVLVLYYPVLYFTLYLLGISSCTSIALSPPCTVLSAQGVDSREIAPSRPDAPRRQSLAIHHLTSYCMRSPLLPTEIFDCIQFKIIFHRARNLLKCCPFNLKSLQV